MSSQEETKINSYFKLRNVVPGDLDQHTLPPIYLDRRLPEDKNAKLLDIGCGFGHLMQAFKNRGYANVTGIDVNTESIDFCKKNDLQVELVADAAEYAAQHPNAYDFATMTHVIEHVPKGKVIDMLSDIKNMLAPGGALYIATPNGQARSGGYWAFEDYTHEVIFTAGSLSYVLRAAGFDDIEFVDKDGLENSRFKLPKKILLSLYRFNSSFWDKVTGAAYHPENPRIDTWELKVIARKRV